jgi:UDP-glucose 4-epimerase
MKVLVTGANGFLGSKLTEKLISSGFQTDCLVYDSLDNFPEKCKILTSLKDIEDIYDFVFHLSSYIPYKNSRISNQNLYKINIISIQNILAKFKKAKIIFSSTVSVYGAPLGILNEKSPFNNPDTYGLSKVCGEFMISFSPNYSILRFSSLYGKGMKKETFLPRIIEQARSENKISLNGDGSRKQDYLHVDDAVNYCLKAAGSNQKGIFLAVNGTSVSNLEIAQIVKKYTGCAIEFSGEDDKIDYFYDNSYTINKLNYQPKIQIEEGIKDLLD